MPFPEGWPPRVPSGIRSIRFYVTGTATANFDDSAFLFSDVTGANPYTPLPVVEPGSSDPVNLGTVPMGTGENDVGSPHPMIFSKFIRITADATGPLEFSFDGVNVHGVIPVNETRVMERYESGIAVRGASVGYTIEAW